MRCWRLGLLDGPLTSDVESLVPVGLVDGRRGWFSVGRPASTAVGVCRSRLPRPRLARPRMRRDGMLCGWGLAERRPARIVEAMRPGVTRSDREIAGRRAAALRLIGCTDGLPGIATGRAPGTTAAGTRARGMPVRPGIEVRSAVSVEENAARSLGRRDRARVALDERLRAVVEVVPLEPETSVASRSSTRVRGVVTRVSGRQPTLQQPFRRPAQTERATFLRGAHNR